MQSIGEDALKKDASGPLNFHEITLADLKLARAPGALPGAFYLLTSYALSNLDMAQHVLGRTLGNFKTAWLNQLHFTQTAKSLCSCSLTQISLSFCFKLSGLGPFDIVHHSLPLSPLPSSTLPSPSPSYHLPRTSVKLTAGSKAAQTGKTSNEGKSKPQPTPEASSGISHTSIADIQAVAKPVIRSPPPPSVR